MKYIEKPDFDNIINEVFSGESASDKMRRFSALIDISLEKSLCEKIWNDYVVPERTQNGLLYKELREADRQIIIKKQQLEERDAKIAELEKELENERTNGRQEWERLRASYIDRFKSELEIQLRNGQAVKRMVHKAITERDSFKSELDKAIKLLKVVGDENIMSWEYQCKIDDFLKDKR